MRALSLSALALGLTACASQPYLPASHWQAGARTASIVAVDSAALPLPAPTACSAAMARARAAGQPVVAVNFKEHRARRQMLAVADPGTPLDAGTWVELWPAHCHDGQLARVMPLPGSAQP